MSYAHRQIINSFIGVDLSLRFLKSFRVKPHFTGIRCYSNKIERTHNYIHPTFSDAQRFRVKTYTNYIFATVFFIAGCGFAAVPLFNTFCSVTNYAGTLNIDLSRDKTKNLKKVPNHELTISFNADKSSYLQWNFKPLQSDIKVVPGETVLAFYTAENPTDKPISGISTYNVAPFEAAKYFNKIQCFCFDEQRLNPHEQVDMPVFFYIDPDIVHDPYLFNIRDITLSYTFFEAVEGLDLPFMSSFRE